MAVVLDLSTVVEMWVRGLDATTQRAVDVKGVIQSPVSTRAGEGARPAINGPIDRTQTGGGWGGGGGGMDKRERKCDHEWAMVEKIKK